MFSLFIYVFSLNGVLGDETECGMNEEYSKCYFDCQKYCNWTTGMVEAPVCDKLCIPGCICKPYYIRQLPNGEGSCIPESECKMCGLNEEYSICTGHCQSYCDWTTGKVVIPPCPKICISGCICKKNYTRQFPEGEGFCIPDSKCKKCPAYEVFSECGFGCEHTCKNLGEPLICPLICRPGCVCDKGYVRKDDINSECILIEDCPKTTTVSY